MKRYLQLIWVVGPLLIGLAGCTDPTPVERSVPADVSIRIGAGDQVTLADTSLTVTYNGVSGVDYFTFEIGENGLISSYGLGQGQTVSVGPERHYLITLEEADEESATVRINQELDLGPLAFDNEMLGEAYNLFQQCAAEVATANTTVHPLIRTAFFVSGRQCAGLGADPSCSYETIEAADRDLRLINLDAEYLGSNPQSFVGVRLRAVAIPEKEGWGSRINYRDKSYDEEPAGWSVSFSQYDNDSQPIVTIRLGPSLTYQLNDTAVATTSATTSLNSLLDALNDPVGLVVEGERYINDLLIAIRLQTEAGTQICAPVTPADDRSTTPECIYRDATAIETALALQEAETDLFGQLEALRSNSDTLHAAASALIPFTDCSP